MKKTKPVITALIALMLLAGCAESRSTLQVDDSASTNATTAPTNPQAMTTAAGSSTTSSQAAETTSTTGARPNAPATTTPSTTAPSTTAPSTTAPSTTIKPAAKKTLPPTTTKSPSSSTSAPATSAPATSAPATSAPASVSPKPGGVYPWFFVPAGQLAEAWGVTGTLIYAGDVVSVISTGANEAVVAVDSFDLRFASRYVGFDDVKVKREGGYTYVSFFCGGIETGGATARHYNVANTKAGALQVTYREGVRTYDVSCGA